MSKQARILVDLVALAAVSALVGGLIGRRIGRLEMESRNNPSTWNEHVSREFDRIVKPTPEQTPRVQAHLDRAVLELQAIRQDTVSRSTNVIGRLIAEVEKELTPEQQKAFETMKPKPGDLDLDVLNNTPPKR